MKAIFTSFPSDTNWVKGRIGSYLFEAKLFDEGSEFGINGGRVSKLSIYKSKINFSRGCIVNYDRGWDVEPKDDTEKEIYNAVITLLENSPIRFNK